ncbi:MAG: hypothetical protein ACRDNS_01260, partial [Trebonia sp.]
MRGLALPARNASPRVWNRYLRRLVRALGGCLSAASAQDRRILVWRTGLGGARPHSERQVAELLGTSLSRERLLERAAAKAIIVRAQSPGGCPAGSSSSALSGTGVAATAGSGASASGVGGGSPGQS